MLIENINGFQRFPSQIIPKSAHTPRWMPLRASSPGSDARVRRQSRPYWVSDLSGCLCNESLKDQLIAMLWRNFGMVRPVLNFVPTFCEIGVADDNRDFWGEKLVTPQVLGTAAPGNLEFQIRKRLLVPGHENEEIYYEVTKPNYLYPPLEGLGRIVSGDETKAVEYIAMPELQIYLGVNPLPADKWTCDRNTGIVTVDADVAGVISATGGFYILMLMPNEIPMTPKGGLYEIEAGVRLEEPFGGR